MPSLGFIASSSPQLAALKLGPFAPHTLNAHRFKTRQRRHFALLMSLMNKHKALNFESNLATPL